MAQTNGRNDETRVLPGADYVPAELAEFGKKRIAAMVELQKEFLETIEAMNQAWFERAKTEANLASELVTKLTAARSVPETANAYQECMTKRMDMLADDGRRIFADSQKFMHLGARLLSNGSATRA
jgi:hypothetical protein